MVQTLRMFSISEPDSGQFLEIEHFIMGVRLDFEDFDINRVSYQRDLCSEVVDIDPAGSKLRLKCTFFNCLKRTQT